MSDSAKPASLPPTRVRYGWDDPADYDADFNKLRPLFLRADMILRDWMDEQNVKETRP